MKLSDFPKNKWGIILDYANTIEIPKKIIEMGLLPNTKFRVMYQAPFGGPIYLEFGREHSKIALRKEEAQFLLVSD